MLFANLLLAGSAYGALHEVWYNVSYALANPDNQFERRVIGVNGTWPPPILNVNNTDTVKVHVYNGLDVPTALHHHGIYFNGSGYFDGAPGLTQCGIPPGQSLTYDIPVDLQNGTYWWHSHVGSQYVDGLRAPFLIHPEEEVHTYDDEYTIILGDWYHEQHGVLIKQFLSQTNPTGAEPVPNSALIYIAHKGEYLPGFNENATIPFEAGKTYRLRIINTSAFAMFYAWLDGHQMRLIEADGTDLEEFPVDYLSLSVAQRYSVLVTAKNTTDTNFAFHANFDTTMFDVVPDGLIANFTTPVVYNAASPTAPEEIKDELMMTMDDAWTPSYVEPQLVANKFIELGVWFDTFDNGVNRAAFNNVTFQMPHVPSLFTELSMGADAANPAVYGPQTGVHILEAGQIVDLQVINWDANAHPFHLHGHKFQIVRIAQDVASDDPALNPPHTEGAANPVRRDTVTIPAGGAVNIRFVADNPGAWVFHCHIEWHFESGLAVVFIEAPAEAQKTLTIPPVMLEHCAMLNIPFTGNAVGKNSTTDLAGVIVGPFPQVHGWLPKAIGALVGTIICALLGMASVVWYTLSGQIDEDEMNEEVLRTLAIKQARGGKLTRMKRALGKTGPVVVQ